MMRGSVDPPAKIPSSPVGLDPSWRPGIRQGANRAVSQDPSRPFGVGLIGWVSGLVGVVGLLAAVAVAAHARRPWALLNGLPALLQVLIAGRFLAGANWARGWYLGHGILNTLAAIVAFIGVLLAVVAAGPSRASWQAAVVLGIILLSGLVGVGFWVYLTRPRVRRYFVAGRSAAVVATLAVLSPALVVGLLYAVVFSGMAAKLPVNLPSRAELRGSAGRVEGWLEQLGLREPEVQPDAPNFYGNEVAPDEPWLAGPEVTVHFRNGEVLRGRIIEETDHEIWFWGYGGRVRFRREEITRIE